MQPRIIFVEILKKRAEPQSDVSASFARQAGMTPPTDAEASKEFLREFSNYYSRDEAPCDCLACNSTASGQEMTAKENQRSDSSQTESLNFDLFKQGVARFCANIDGLLAKSQKASTVEECIAFQKELNKLLRGVDLVSTFKDRLITEVSDLKSLEFVLKSKEKTKRQKELEEILKTVKSLQLSEEEQQFIAQSLTQKPTADAQSKHSTDQK